MPHDMFLEPIKFKYQLDGGTLATRLVESPGAPLGDLLQANANNAAFMTGLTAANVLAGGAIIDSSTIAQPLLDGGTGGGLIKKGSGLLVLSGGSTYTGATIVSNGTFEVNGSIASPTVDVKAGDTLGGTGSIAGSATIETGGTLAGRVGGHTHGQWESDHCRQPVH